MALPESVPQDVAPLRCWREGGIAHLRFNRPQAMNAIDLPMAQAFHQACRQISDDPAVQVLVLSGEGRAFMAGGDLQSMAADPTAVAAELIGEMHAGIELLADLPAPVIASVHGAVAGGGLGLALACDLIVAAEGTRFNLAYTRIGTSSDCGTSWGLPRWVGLRKALEIALLCEPFDAAEALRLGMINRVVPADALAEHTLALARQLEASAPLALGRLKRLMRQSDQNDLHTQLQAEARDFVACAGTADFAEGVSAFLAKRPARFSGR
ncbi:MAG: enoyl-CoA hydratase-related protein [Hydrogenophaga sp.]|nr:enoyl-CoA hydratase-related protein [Hydrogenophaga sp.]